MYILKVSGDVVQMEANSLEAIQKAVGGNIQIINTNDGRVMALDEDGKLKGYLMNQEACKLTFESGLAPDDYVVGDVVVMNAGELE